MNKTNIKQSEMLKTYPAVNSNIRGFTLVELMIVVALIAIIGFIAGPEIMTFKPSIELNSASQDLFSGFQNAKMAALRENRNCAITFNPTIGGTNYDYAIYMDEDTDFIPDAAERTLALVNFSETHEKVSFDPAEMTFPNNGNGNPSIAFQPNGLPALPGGAIGNGTAFLKAEGTDAEKVVVINKVGNIRINNADNEE